MRPVLALEYGNWWIRRHQNAVTGVPLPGRAGFRLTEGPPSPLLPLSAGWMAASPMFLRIGGEESPGSMEARCRITSGGGDPRDSATESKPPGHRLRAKGR